VEDELQSCFENQYLTPANLGLCKAVSSLLSSDNQVTTVALHVAQSFTPAGTSHM